MNELVSIIMPTFNSAEFIELTLISVQNQSYEEWELLVIDDKSTDSTVELIKQYAATDNRIKLILNKENLGPGPSRNKGISRASGRYVAFLDSDDLWKENKLIKQINFMRSHSYLFTYSFYDQIDEDGNLLRTIDNLPNSVNYLSTLKSNKIGCLTVIYDQSFFGKIYMEEIPRRQDYTLWLKLLKRIPKAYCCNDNLASYRIRKGSISSNKLKLVADHWNIYSNIENHSFAKSLYFLLNYIAAKVLRL